MSYYIFDEWGMPLVVGDPNSWKDSIGRLMEMEYAKNGLTEVVPALENCLHIEDGQYKLKRHPGYLEKSSRDHWSYFIQYKKNTLSEDEFVVFMRFIPPMRGMILWCGALTGDDWSEWWFYTIFNLGARIHNFLDWAIVGIGNLGLERSNHWWLEYGSKYQASKTRWQRFWSKAWGIIVPFYPVQNRAWQLKFLPESPRKEKQKRIYLKRTDRGNPIVRILFGDKDISVYEIENYPEMAGDRSGVRLNLSCDRWIHEIDDGYKRKLLIRLHNENN